MTTLGTAGTLARVGEYDTKIASFSRIWEGGYFEGDPRDHYAWNSYRSRGYVSTLYVIYLTCIKPFINSGTNVLEIGPGRGAFTRTFVAEGAREVWALDAAPAAHTHFYDYVGHHDNVHYLQVSDCNLTEIADDSIDYFFTFGVFCHLPNEMVADYIAHLPPKMRSSANGFMMVGDFEKYNKNADEQDALQRLFSLKRYAIHRYVDRIARRLMPSHFAADKLDVAAGVSKRGEGGLGSWYHMSTDRACELLEQAGFEIVTRDVGANPRDPIIHFRKP